MPSPRRPSAPAATRPGKSSPKLARAAAAVFSNPLPNHLPDDVRSLLSAQAGVPWQKATAMPQFNPYQGLLPDSFYRFTALQNMGVAGVTGAVFYESKFSIDSDGASAAEDSSHQDETSLRHPDGSSLDARKDLYAVLPLDAAQAAREGFKKRPGLPDFGGLGLRLGDVGLAFWKGKQAVFVYADEGPPDLLGEGSVALAKALGIDADPSVGGFDEQDLRDLGKGVVHVAFPGSGDWSGRGQPRTACTPAQIEQLALALWAAFRANGTA